MPKTIATRTDALENAARALREIYDSFTTPAGDFIEDDLTRVEWRQMAAALEHLDAFPSEETQP